MRLIFVYFWLLVIGICVTPSRVAAMQLEVDARDAREPYKVTVIALQDAVYATRTEMQGAITRFQFPATSYVFVELQYASGFVLARTVQLAPANAPRARVVLRREDAVFAQDLQNSFHTVAVSSLASERQMLAMVDRFEAHMETGATKEAVDLLWEMTEIQPGSVLAWNNLGAIAFAQGRLEEANGHFRRALEISPGSFEANLNLSRVHVAKGELDRANRHAREAARIRPGHPSALAQHVQVLLLMERYLEAKPLLETLLRVDPHHGSFPELGLSVVLDHLGEPLEAARCVLAWADRHPGHPENQRLRKRARAHIQAVQAIAGK
ncbi:MAG: tetratricopeptide repeat protein [Bryobacterales bacterium]|nr:tetratricopeptide repeat protein [Bryobacterales bacterium]